MAQTSDAPARDGRRVISSAPMTRRHTLILVGVGVAIGGGVALTGLLDDEPTALWTGLFTLALTAVLALGRTTIAAHPQDGLTLSSYGVFREEIPWEKIDSVERSEPTGFMAGMGLRRMRGGATGYLNGGDSVMIAARGGRYRVSTRRPEDVVAEISSYLEAAARR